MTVQWIADILRVAVVIHPACDLGAGTPVTLQKPNKPQGPVTNLRPIIIMKMEPVTFCHRSYWKHSDPSRIKLTAPLVRLRGCSCADIIFAKRLHCSTATLCMV